MKNFCEVERFRIAGVAGEDGAFAVPNPLSHLRKTYLQIIASRGLGWDHVSVTVRGTTDSDAHFTPSWDEMCYVKDLFFRADECAMQLHPPNSEYINHHPNVLHLWRPQKDKIPRPEFKLARTMV